MRPTHVLLWIAPPIPNPDQDLLMQALIEKAKAASAEVFPGSHVSVSEPALAELFTIPLRFGKEARTCADSLRDRLLEMPASGGAPGSGNCRAFSIQALEVRTAPKRLACFDMDSTLINQEVIDEMARTFGFHDPIAAITEEAMQGKLDFREALLKRVALFRGLSRERALGILPSLRVSPGGEALLSFLKTRGFKTAVISGGFDFILEPFRQSLGLDHACGNTLPLDAMGNFTGAVSEPIVDAARKRELVSGLRKRYGFKTSETVAVGDGANDLLMMEEAGISVSFCGKKALSGACNTFILDRNLLWLKSLL